MELITILICTFHDFSGKQNRKSDTYNRKKLEACISQINGNKHVLCYDEGRKLLPIAAACEIARFVETR